MYCGQCGKKVMDTMLFCPFCGSPIVIPDQDVSPSPAPAKTMPEQKSAEAKAVAHPAESFAAEREEAPVAPAAEPKQESMERKGEKSASDQERKAPRSLFDTEEGGEPVRPEPQEDFVPLSFSFDAAGEDESVSDDSLELPEAAPEKPKRREPSQRQEKRGKRAANTYIPVKDVAPQDIFMDEDEYDMDGDEDEEFDFGYADEDEYEFEDRDEGSFFQRHIRGFVGLILLSVLLVICIFWANTESGQATLARFNLAWKAQPYAQLGYDAYMEDNDLMAAQYYAKALSRDEDNYDYAHSAMVAYYEAQDIEASAAMLRRCINMEPDNPEPYQEMLILYPDPEARPWEIQELLRQGYARTGDPSLKQD